MGDESQASFAARVGITQSSLNRLLHGGDPTLDTLIGIANAGGVTVGWLATGDDQGGHEPGAEEQVGIALLAFHASAGKGAEVTDAGAKLIRFSRQTLQRLHLKAENARLLYAAGDSMRPTIEDGDPLLVDVGDTDIIDGRIYVFSIGDQVLVKRLRRLGSRLLMRADNRDLYPDEEEVPMIEPVRIIGRVKWVGRSL